jgi:hypothetical protein
LVAASSVTVDNDDTYCHLDDIIAGGAAAVGERGWSARTPGNNSPATAGKPSRKTD